MPILVESYISGAGALRVLVNHSPSGVPLNGNPGTRTTMLDGNEAQDLLRQLTRALAAPPECIDCGSTLHTVDDPSCPVSNAGERDE